LKALVKYLLRARLCLAKYVSINLFPLEYSLYYIIISIYYIYFSIYRKKI